MEQTALAANGATTRTTVRVNTKTCSIKGPCNIVQSVHTQNYSNNPVHSIPVNPSCPDNTVNPGHLYHLEFKGGWGRMSSNLEVHNRCTALVPHDEPEEERAGGTSGSKTNSVFLVL